MSTATAVVEVGTEYRHVAKLVRPGALLELDPAVLKWYEIAPADAPVPPRIRELAQRALRSAGADGLQLRQELGFAILHRCGADFYFLIVSTWRNDNELWSTVWAKNGDEDHAFRSWPTDAGHHPTFCVWELAAVCFERRAWSDYLRSPRDEAARSAYVQVAYAGEA